MSLNFCVKICIYLNIAAISTFVFFIWAVYSDLYPSPPPLPSLETKWFGDPLAPHGTNNTITPFTVNVSDAILVDLKERLGSDLNRLRNSHSFDPIVESFEYGFNMDYLINTIGEYWLNQYNWRNREKLINEMGSHYKTEIEGLEVHFIHIKPNINNVRILPLLMVHGWPGSFIEFYEAIQLLTTKLDGQSFIFEVIIPSIPGYTFSSPPQRPGFHVGHCAQMLYTLMVDRLGFKEGFYMQGGDWGSLITTALATLYPDSVIGLHLNMAISIKPSAILKSIMSVLAPHRYFDAFGMKYIYPRLEKFGRVLEESGYFHIQATKPDTLGVALNTSPIGLAAYILEKFSTWTRYSHKLHSDGGLLRYYSLDQLLDNVMLYWVTNSITSSMRFYKENVGILSFMRFHKENVGNHDETKHDELFAIQMNPIYSVPVAVAAFSDEIFLQTKDELSGKFRNIIQYTSLPDGGHFAAMENPKRLVEDFVKFVNKVETNRDQIERISSYPEL